MEGPCVNPKPKTPRPEAPYLRYHRYSMDLADEGVIAQLEVDRLMRDADELQDRAHHAVDTEASVGLLREASEKTRRALVKRQRSRRSHAESFEWEYKAAEAAPDGGRVDKAILYYSAGWCAMHARLYAQAYDMAGKALEWCDYDYICNDIRSLRDKAQGMMKK